MKKGVVGVIILCSFMFFIFSLGFAFAEDCRANGGPELVWNFIGVNISLPRIGSDFNYSTNFTILNAGTYDFSLYALTGPEKKGVYKYLRIEYFVQWWNSTSNSWVNGAFINDPDYGNTAYMGSCNDNNCGPLANMCTRVNNNCTINLSSNLNLGVYRIYYTFAPREAVLDPNLKTLYNLTIRLKPQTSCGSVNKTCKNILDSGNPLSSIIECNYPEVTVLNGGGSGTCTCNYECRDGVASCNALNNINPFTNFGCNSTGRCQCNPDNICPGGNVGDSCGDIPNGCGQNITCGCISENKCYNGVCVSATCPAGQMGISPNCIDIVDIGAFNWVDMNGAIKSQVDLRDSVLAYFGESSSGKPISYKIMKNRILSDEEIVSGITTNGYVVWKATENGDYYFEMTLSNGIKNTSQILNVKNTLNNTKPVVSISSILPQNILTIGSQNIKVFVRNQPIALNKTVRDEDDLINLKWYFGGNLFDGLDLYSYFLDNTLGNVVYSPTYASNFYKIILSAQEQESERLQNVNDSVNIYLLEDGINVIPLISKPNEFTLQNSFIDFDASSSVVLNCVTGNCPSGTCFSLAGKNCNYIHASGTKLTGSSYNLTVSWKILDKLGNVYANFTGDWNKDYNSSVQFIRFFNNKGEYSAQVNLEYSNNLIRKNATSLSVSFLTTTGWNCTRSSTTAIWGKNSVFENATSNCSKYIGDTGYSCCPTTKNRCLDDDTCGEQVSYCSDLKTKAQCEKPAEEVVMNSFYGNYYNLCTKQTYISSDCTGYNDCGCFWNGKNCSEGYEAKKICGEDKSDIGVCTFETAVTGSCSTDNMVTVSSKAFPPLIGSDLLATYFSDCKDSSTSLPCPSTAKLPFASGWSILIAVVVIVLVYLIIRKGFYKKHL